eukprot:6184888-Pleurochrysis_carterae.AAC.2
MQGFTLAGIHACRDSPIIVYAQAHTGKRGMRAGAHARTHACTHAARMHARSTRPSTCSRAHTLALVQIIIPCRAETRTRTRTRARAQTSIPVRARIISTVTHVDLHAD